MGKGDRVVRVNAALFEAAVAEGNRQSRSARQQLEHWARLGAALCVQMDSPLNRVRLALDGRIAQQDLTVNEARQFDAAVAVRLDDAVSHADFASAPLPNFASFSPDPDRVLTALTDQVSDTQRGEHARDRLREALAHLGVVLDSMEQPSRGLEADSATDADDA